MSSKTMWRRIALTTLMLGMAAAGCSAPAPYDTSRVRVKLGQMPDVSLSPAPPLSDAQTRHIKELIASLANLDKTDFGLSATMSGMDFAPLPGHEDVGALLLTDHGLGQSTALKELVTLGPDALPFLLDALDDQTPTKVVIEHGFQMWFSRWVRVNPVNPAEMGIGHDLVEKEGADDHIDAYTIKVGDVCFVAIGQIVGRAYEAVRYQPTACIILTSPASDPTLCERIRGIWKSDDPRRKLFDSLCADYVTMGLYNDHDLMNGWGVGSDYQCAAAMRMLFYFPKETASLLASRLEKLNVGKDASSDDFLVQYAANDVQPDDFIKAVSWSSDPAIRAALLGVFKRADHLNSLLAALPAVEDKDLIRQRLESRVISLPRDDFGPYGDANHLLTALLQRTPDTAKAMFDRYLRHRTAERCSTVCATLSDAKVTWDIDVLLPMLSDKRTFGWTYAVGDPNHSRLPIRVCDDAAATLSQNHPALKFTQAGKYADLDRQIAAIRTALTTQRVP